MVSLSFLTLVVDHMMLASQTGYTRPGADPVHVVLRRVLQGTLSRLDDEYDAGQLIAAANIVNRATAICEKELLFVPPGAFDDLDDELPPRNRAERREQVRRRRSH